MKTISNFLYRIANWKSLVLFLAIYVVFPAYFLKNAEAKINELAGKEVGIVDLTIGFNPQQTLDMVAAYGDEARAYYAQVEMTIDVVYPIVYAILIGIILSLLFKNTALSMVNVLPFATVLLDYIENSNTVTLLYSYPQQSMFFATLCEIFKLSKWLSLGVIILFIIYGLILKVKGSKSTT